MCRHDPLTVKVLFIPSRKEVIPFLGKAIVPLLNRCRSAPGFKVNSTSTLRSPPPRCR